MFVTSAVKIEIMIGNDPPLYFMLIPNAERHFIGLLRVESYFFSLMTTTKIFTMATRRNRKPCDIARMHCFYKLPGYYIIQLEGCFV